MTITGFLGFGFLLHIEVFPFLSGVKPTDCRDERIQISHDI